MEKQAKNRLWCWLCFTVLVSLFPFGEPFFTSGIDDARATFDLIFGRGDLLLVCGALGAAAIGELLANRKGLGTRRIVVGFLCFGLVILSTHTYDKVVSANARGIFHPSAVAWRSILLFTLTTISSTLCFV